MIKCKYFFDALTSFHYNLELNTAQHYLGKGSVEATEQYMLAPDCSPIHPGFSGKLGLNLALGLGTSCCGHQTACWRPACCWLG